jgi:GNAT superfamily N-acetyltransferase
MFLIGPKAHRASLISFGAAGCVLVCADLSGMALDPLETAEFVGCAEPQHRGRGLGAALLFDAITRAARADAAIFAILVDAKDDAAAAFYRRHGFAPFAARPRNLFLPLGTAIRLVES